MRQMSGRVSVFGLRRGALAARLAEWGEPRYRADQVFFWVYQRGVVEPAAMTSLPRTLRERLVEEYLFALPEVEARVEADDGAVKYCLRLADGERVECVSMPRGETKEDREDREAKEDKEAREAREDGGGGGVSLCLSSQVGCPLGCIFCRTGAVGFRRDLSAAEIVAQALVMLGDPDYRPDHVNLLLMGMGEPLLNTDAVAEALAIMSDSEGLAVPMRRVVVSTAGLPEEMRRLLGAAALPGPPRLALSLNASNQALREELMPVARRHPLEELMEVLRELPPRREPPTVEYVLLAGVNDGVEQARELAALLRESRVRAKVNLIPYNACEGLDFEAPDEPTIGRFLSALSRAGVTATVRRSRGRSAAAACGQLAAL